MEGLNQQDQERAIIQVEQDIVHLVSHQLLNSAYKLQIIYELWSEPEASLEQLQADALHILRHEVTYLHRLGRDVLQLDPTASVELPLNLKPVDLVDLIKQMLPSFRLQGPDREFESYYEADLPPVWGDTERLRDVLDNLISNAVKYSPPFSSIIISMQRDDDQIRVSVTNFGSFIPAGDEERVFTKFYRGNGHRQSGYGLGLYLTRRLVEQHGGRIWVESSPAKTTTFHFTLLPAGQEQPVPSLSSKADPPTPSVRNNSSKGNGTINVNDHLSGYSATAEKGLKGSI
jgi:signal transduction histidine kinase